jgi:hypothetical protein
MAFTYTEPADQQQPVSRFLERTSLGRQYPVVKDETTAEGRREI